MATTITKEQFLNAIKPSCKTVEVQGVGKMLVRTAGEVQRSRRIARLYDENGNINEEQFALRRIHTIVDQVMLDEKTPMFTEKEALEWADGNSHLVDRIYAAIDKVNSEDAGKKDESPDSSEN